MIISSFGAAPALNAISTANISAGSTIDASSAKNSTFDFAVRFSSALTSAEIASASSLAEEVNEVLPSVVLTLTVTVFAPEVCRHCNRRSASGVRDWS